MGASNDCVLIEVFLPRLISETIHTMIATTEGRAQPHPPRPTVRIIKPESTAMLVPIAIPTPRVRTAPLRGASALQTISPPTHCKVMTEVSDAAHMGSSHVVSRATATITNKTAHARKVMA